MSGYQLGDRVTMNGTVTKVRIDLPGPEGGFKTTYTDDSLPRCYDVDGGIDYTSGIIVGRRFLQEGVTKYVGEWPETERAFKQSGVTHRVWVVAYDLRRKPVMCFDHQISKENSDA